MNYNDFVRRFKVPVSLIEYNTASKAIPKGFIHLLKGLKFNQQTQNLGKQLFIEEIHVTVKKMLKQDC